MTNSLQVARDYPCLNSFCFYFDKFLRLSNQIMPPTLSKPILKHFNQNVSNILSPTTDLVSTICKLIQGLKSWAVSIRTKKRKWKAKFSCGVCRKNVNINHRAVQCDQCNNWVHIKCNGITPKDYESLKNEDQNRPWTCLTCAVLQTAEIFPFGLIGNDISLTMNGLDNLCCINNIPNYHPLHNLNSFVKEHNIIKSLALYHVNINSSDKHIDELRTVLAYPNINWDIIAISETGNNLMISREISILMPLISTSQPSKSRKGSVGLYINNKLNHFERDDMKVQTNEFETVWFELINKHENNILCCCTHRHPDSDPMKFIERFEKMLKRRSLSLSLGISTLIYLVIILTYKLMTS